MPEFIATIRMKRNKLRVGYWKSNLTPHRVNFAYLVLILEVKILLVILKFLNSNRNPIQFKCAHKFKIIV